MWQRTKRLINSYLDDLIDRVSGPDREVREVTRAEKARLLELEAQTRASIKLLEKELAETELKMVGVSERERMARERGDTAQATSAASELVSLSSHAEFLKQQILEARGSAERARALREQRSRQGEEIVTDVHLTTMRENVAGLNQPFKTTDPAATIEEMRARLGAQSSTTDARIAEIEAEQKRAQVDELLARYKQSTTGSEPDPIEQARPPQTSSSNPGESAPTNRPIDDEGTEQPKTLGRNEGPIKPID